MSLGGGEPWPEIGQVRWTTGRVEIRVPERYRKQATSLRLDLASSGPDGTRLRIELDGRRIFSQKLKRLPEDRVHTIRVPLPETGAGDLDLVLECKTFVPKKRYRKSEDDRELGVALAGFELLLQEP